jgi:two-component system osmolarity sensor histidine kinase EnvZ
VSDNNILPNAPTSDVTANSNQRLVPRYRLLRRTWRRIARYIAGLMPSGLFARSLIIIIAPMLILQAIIAFVFMERHWQSVTTRLSASVVRDVAGLVDVIETYPQDANFETVSRIARERFDLRVSILPEEELPAPRPKPFFSILDTALSEQLTRRIDKPFWIDTVGKSDLLEIRIRLERGVLRAFVPRNQAYASNTHIFLLWMVGASVVLVLIAILFLRNQIRPIQRLAEAAERFGKGQQISEDFKPRGATEVRRATVSFLEMRDRIERALEQRTTMLAGVSHDLRTVLTRFRLQLAFVPKSKEVEALSGDIDDMQSMLEGYLDFARGESGEEASDINIHDVFDRFSTEATTLGKQFEISVSGEPIVHVRQSAFTRLMSNLIGNGFRYAQSIKVTSKHFGKMLTIDVEDDGPGVPAENYADVFKPFYRLDNARNLDSSGTGLGLAIARDIVHTHGGHIQLGESEMGGLKVSISIPA